MIRKTLVNEKVCGWHPVSVEGQVAVMFWDALCVSNMHFPKKDVIEGIKGPCKNKLQTQPSSFVSLSLSHSPTMFILRVPLDPAGAGPWHWITAWYSSTWSLVFLSLLWCRNHCWISTSLVSRSLSILSVTCQLPVEQAGIGSELSGT